MSKDSGIVSVFLNYRSQLRRAVSGIVRSEDIDDIVQETFVKSYEAELKQEIRYERTYMLKTAKHLALNHVAKFSEKYNQSLEDSDASSVYLSSASLETQFESKERFLHFCRATDTLSEEVKRAFILKKVYGLSQKEIAAYLNLAESTIEKHVAKGLMQCSVYMKDIALQDDDRGQKSAAAEVFSLPKRNTKL
jgi:RNA polymerase sigma factor (sigma-70 family)